MYKSGVSCYSRQNICKPPQNTLLVKSKSTRRKHPPKAPSGTRVYVQTFPSSFCPCGKVGRKFQTFFRFWRFENVQKEEKVPKLIQTDRRMTKCAFYHSGCTKAVEIRLPFFQETGRFPGGGFEIWSETYTWHWHVSHLSTKVSF